MSLFSTLQLTKNSLVAAQLGLQVTGNNIANADTPDYIRQELVVTPAKSQQVGDLLLGLGVQVEGIVQQFDEFLEERLRGANSELKNAEVQENSYKQLEALLGELSDTDLSSSLNKFFSSIHDILNQPESRSIRNLAVLQGETLASDIRRLDQRVQVLRKGLNDRVVGAADEVNQLLEEVARLNVQIVAAEGGGARTSDAVGLRDRRVASLGKLSEIMDVRVIEQPTGAVSVFSGGDFLVFEGTSRSVETRLTSDRGLSIATVQLAETDAAIQSTSGELAGLVAARDGILGTFLDDLKGFARSLMFEFNRVHSKGQGLAGYSELNSEFAVDDVEAALDEAGLSYTPENGSFDVKIRNKQTGITQTTNVKVQLNGFDDDTTLTDLAESLDAIDGLAATLTPARDLQLRTESGNLEFSFARDTSGTLAALGFNTFFSGSSSVDIRVNQAIKEDPAKFAASATGQGEDTENAVALANLYEQKLESQGGDSLADRFDRLTGNVTQSTAVTRSVAEGFRVFQKTLQGEKLGISGVNLDEEAVRMITYQRSYQASARVIATLSELLETLVSL